MRTALRVLFYLLAAEVVVQAMAIAFGIAGLGKWVDDGHSATKALFDNDNADFGGKTGFAIHGMNGMMVIPVLVLVLLIVSFFAKVPGATKNAAILLGLVVLQVVLGISAHGAPGIIVVHVLNAFVIFSFAAMTAWRVGNSVAVDAPRETASV
jgi:heme A synthase